MTGAFNGMLARLKPFMAMLLRGTALALALWLAADLALAVLADSGQPGRWLVDLRPLPQWGRWGVLILALAGLMSVAVQTTPRLRRLALIALAPLLLALLVNSIQFYALLARGWIDAPPLPLTLVVAVALVAVMRLPVAAPHRARLRGCFAITFTAMACLGALALAQMFLFGKTDYRRPADAIVVLGARTYADGRLSDALRDRIATGVRLYHEGLAPCLIVSGPGRRGGA
jgi:hypothetical protein